MFGMPKRLYVEGSEFFEKQFLSWTGTGDGVTRVFSTAFGYG